MKKIALVVLMGMGSFSAISAQASGAQGVGVAVNYGLISGPALELSYPISNTLQVRGAVSGGMGVSETASDTDVDYKVKSEGGIHRLNLDYHPFENGFFVSGGYAVNAFKLKANGSSTGAVTIGETDYTNSNANLNGELEWENGATLSMGWGHSPAAGWGAMFEIGAIFTGAADVSLSGTGTVTDSNGTYDVSNDPSVLAALREEEAKLQKDVGDFDFLPILQAGVTYRF